MSTTARFRKPDHVLINGEIPSLIWHVSGAGSRPAIISVHGGGGNKADVDVPTVEQLLEAGIALITIDAFKHGERAPTDFDMTRTRRNLADFVDIIEHTARDLFTVIDFLNHDSSIDTGHIGLRGGSMGGYIVLMAAGLGLPSAALLSICGGAGFERMWDLRGGGRASAGAQAVLDRAPAIDPIYHPDAIAPRPILMIHGERDPIVPIVGQQNLYRALVPHYAAHPGDCLFLIHAGEHGTPPEIERLGWEWLTSKLLGGDLT